MKKQCGQIFNRGRFIVTVVMVPIIIIFALSDKILVGLGQDPEVSHISRVYVTILIPGVWALGQFDATKRFLSAQYSTDIPVWTQLITTIFHFLWCWLFIWKMDGREKGAAIATNITWIMNMLICDCVIRYKKHYKEDPDLTQMIRFYDMSVFRDINVYLKIGIPNMLMLCCEWWIFEILTIFSGLLGVTQLATEVVIVNCITFIFMIPLGISYAASALTGNYLGEGKIDLAKKFASMTVIFDIIITSVVVLLLGIFQESIARIFTNEEEVIKTFKSCVWVLLIYVWFDTIHGVQSGIIRGLGRQMFGFFYTMFCYVILGFPLALCLCFNGKMGIAGLWLGMTIACIILDVGFAMIISCPNWEKIANKMRSTLEAGAGRTPEVNAYREAFTPSQSKRQIAAKSNAINEAAPQFGA